MYCALRHGQRVQVTRLADWNGVAPHPALLALVGRVGVVVARPGAEWSRAHGEATFTIYVEGWGEVRLRPDEIAPLGRRREG